MKNILRVIHGNNKDKGTEYVLCSGETLIGRSAEAQFRLTDMSISSKQCLVGLENDRITVRNLSQFGTRIGSRLLLNDDTEILSAEQIIQIGDDTEIELILEDDAPEQTIKKTNLEDAATIKIAAQIDKTVHGSTSQAATSSDATRRIKQSVVEQKASGNKAQDFAGEETKPNKPSHSSTIADNGGNTVPPTRHSPKNNGPSPAEDIPSESSPQDSSPDKTRPKFNVPPMHGASDNGGNTVHRQRGNMGENGRSSQTSHNVNHSASGNQNPDGKTRKAQSAGQTVKGTGTVPLSGDHTATLPNQTQSGFIDFPEEWSIWEKIQQWLQNHQYSKWGGVAVCLLIVFIWQIVLEKRLEKLRPETSLNFKYIKVKGKKEKIADVVEIGAFQLPSQEPKGSKDSVMSSSGDERHEQLEKNPLFHLVCPRSSKLTCQLENDGNLQTVRTFIGRSGKVPLNMFLSRQENLDFLCEDFSLAKERVINDMSQNNGIHFDDRATDLYDFTNFLFSEGKGSLNGLRYWQATYTRPDNWQNGRSSAEQEKGTEDAMLQGTQDGKRGWYGVLVYFRNKDVDYILRVEVPEYMAKQAEQFLTTNTFLRFHGQGKYGDSDFITLSWDGSRATKKRSLHLEEEFKAFKKNFNKQDNPHLYTEQEARLKYFLATAEFNKNENIMNDALGLLETLRRQRQQNYYNQLRLQWIEAKGSKNEAIRHKQIRNDAELVFNNAEDARYNMVRSDKWD